MQHLREVTGKQPIVVGRKTYETFGEIGSKYRPLPGRKNIVVSSNFDTGEDIVVVGSIDDALKEVEGQDVSVIGGSHLYNATVPEILTHLEITKIHRDYEGDTFFECDKSKWNKINDTGILISEKSKIPY